EQVLRGLEIEQPEPPLAGRPDELAARGVAPRADGGRRRDQDRRTRSDLLDDLRVDRTVAGVLAVRVAGVDVNHRRSGLVAARRRFADLGGLLWDHGAVPVLLHAAV